MRILIHRPKWMRVSILREELLVFFDWNHCAAHVAHILERKTAFSLDNMELHGQKEGLLWIEVSDEFLHTEMLKAYSVRTIRDTLNMFEEKGIIVTAKDRPGKTRHLLFNYELIDQNVGARSLSQMETTPAELPVYDTPAILLGSDANPGKISEKLPGSEGPIKSKVLQEQENPLTSPLRASRFPNQNQNLTGGKRRSNLNQRRERPRRKGLGALVGELVKGNYPQDNDSCNSQTRGATEEVGEAVCEGSDISVAPRASCGESTPGVETTTGYPEKWNARFPTRQVSWSAGSHRAFKDPVFAKNFEPACDRVEQILKKNPDADLNLFTLMRYKDGTSTCALVASGWLDFLMNMGKGAGKKQAISQEEIKKSIKEMLKG